MQPNDALHDVPSLVGPEVLAQDYGVEATTVRRWAREGRIPHIRVSNKILRFDRQRVLEALEIPTK